MQVSNSPYCGCLYYSANALARVVTHMAEEAFAATGLSPSHAFLLMSVIRQPGISSGQAAELMQLTPSTVTRLAGKCIEKGLMERKTEGKFTLLFPTEAGKERETLLVKAWQSMSLQFQNRIGEAQAVSLTGSIASAVDALEA